MVNTVYAVSLERGKKLKSEQRFIGAVYKVDYCGSLHNFVLKIRGQPFCRLFNCHAASVCIIFKLVPAYCADIEIR